jgi:hypothetical protein
MLFCTIDKAPQRWRHPWETQGSADTITDVASWLCYMHHSHGTFDAGYNTPPMPCCTYAMPRIALCLHRAASRRLAFTHILVRGTLRRTSSVQIFAISCAV